MDNLDSNLHACELEWYVLLVCVRACTYVCVCVHASVHRVCVCVCVHVRTCICMYAVYVLWVYTWGMHVCIHMCMLVCTDRSVTVKLVQRKIITCFLFIPHTDI